MASYIIRIELHSATYSDYETLHSAMEREGFSRTITADNGTTYQLPTAEYSRVTYLTRSQVLQSAKSAASTTQKSFEVLVAETVASSWSGLQPV